MTIVETARCEG